MPDQSFASTIAINQGIDGFNGKKPKLATQNPDYQLYDEWRGQGIVLCTLLCAHPNIDKIM